jgi:protein-S-isoprenylcysteine O-methyltransferase Ste14
VYPLVFLGNQGSSVQLVVAFWIVFYVWIGSELFLGWKLRAGRATTKQDAGSKWILIGSIWFGIALGFALAVLTPALAFNRYRLTLFIVGMIFMLAGLALRWYSIWFLGRSFTCDVATRPGQEVIDTGPYRWLRHPSYTGSLLTVLGALLCLTNPVSLLALVVPLAGYAYRIRVEEQVLVRDLGEPYRRYMKRTKRLIPFIV